MRMVTVYQDPNPGSAFWFEYPSMKGRRKTFHALIPASPCWLCIGFFHAELPLLVSIAVHPSPGRVFQIFNSARKWPLVNFVSYDSEVISFDLHFRKDVKTDADDISLLSNF